MRTLHELSESEVHIWYAPVSREPHPDEVARCKSVLSSSERERYERFGHRGAQLEFLTGRMLLRTTLSRYQNAAPTDWEFETNRYGRPEIVAPPSNLRFNLSHSHGWVACAVVREREIGVDIEFSGRSSDFDAIAETVFSELELKAFRALSDPSVRRQRFYDLWTLKEAYIKARGVGLSLPLQKITFLHAEAERFKIQLDPSLQDPAEDWQVELLQGPSPGHKAALAVRAGRSFRLRLIEKTAQLED